MDGLVAVAEKALGLRSPGRKLAPTKLCSPLHSLQQSKSSSSDQPDSTLHPLLQEPPAMLGSLGDTPASQVGGGCWQEERKPWIRCSRGRSIPKCTLRACIFLEVLLQMVAHAQMTSQPSCRTFSTWLLRGRTPGFPPLLAAPSQCPGLGLSPHASFKCWDALGSASWPFLCLHFLCKRAFLAPRL